MKFETEYHNHHLVVDTLEIVINENIKGGNQVVRYPADDKSCNHGTRAPYADTVSDTDFFVKEDYYANNAVSKVEDSSLSEEMYSCQNSSDDEEVHQTSDAEEIKDTDAVTIIDINFADPTSVSKSEDKCSRMSSADNGDKSNATTEEFTKDLISCSDDQDHSFNREELDKDIPKESEAIIQESVSGNTEKEVDVITMTFEPQEKSISARDDDDIQQFKRTENVNFDAATYMQEDSNFQVGPVISSGHIAYTRSISIRSDSSATSARSFAFPILQSEWNSSPVKMAKARRRRRRMRLCCCKF